MSSSVHVGNKKKVILILGEGPEQGLDCTKLTAQKNIQLILLQITKTFAWACIIMKQTITYFAMVQKFINLKQKILKL